jgi:hypothetical protein
VVARFAAANHGPIPRRMCTRMWKQQAATFFGAGECHSLTKIRRGGARRQEKSRLGGIEDFQCVSCLSTRETGGPVHRGGGPRTPPGATVKRKNGATVFGNQAATVPPLHLSVAVADALFLGSCHPSPSARRFLAGAGLGHNRCEHGFADLKRAGADLGQRCHHPRQ